MVNTFFIAFLLWLSIKKKISTSYTVYPAYVLFNLRASLRIADFEGTKELMTLKQWHNIELLQQYAFSFMCAFYMFLFFNIRGSMLVFVIMCSFNLIIVTYTNGFTKLDANDYLIIIYFFLLACFIGQFTYI